MQYSIILVYFSANKMKMLMQSASQSGASGFSQSGRSGGCRVSKKSHLRVVHRVSHSRGDPEVVVSRKNRISEWCVGSLIVGEIWRLSCLKKIAPQSGASGLSISGRSGGCRVSKKSHLRVVRRVSHSQGGPEAVVSRKNRTSEWCAGFLRGVEVRRLSYLEKIATQNGASSFYAV